MKIANWLDEKEAEGLDVSHIELPDDLVYDEAPEETIYFKESICAESSVPATIHFLP